MGVVARWRKGATTHACATTTEAMSSCTCQRRQQGRCVTRPPCPGRAPHTLTRSARADRGLCPGVTLGPSGRARGSADPLIRRSQQGVGATSEEVGIPRVNPVPSSRTRLGHWRTAHAAMRAALLLLPWALATAEDGAPYPVLDATARRALRD